MKPQHHHGLLISLNYSTSILNPNIIVFCGQEKPATSVHHRKAHYYILSNLLFLILLFVQPPQILLYLPSKEHNKLICPQSSFSNHVPFPSHVLFYS